MKIIEVNGVSLLVHPVELTLKYPETPPAFSWIKERLVTFTHMTWPEVLVMAGMDRDKTDFATPQAWFDKNPDTRNTTVWYYGNKDTYLFGEPINLLEKLQQLGGIVAEKYLAALEYEGQDARYKLSESELA